MKKNDWFLLISTAAYSYLFYQQSAGINFFIFSVLLTALCAIRDTGFLKKPAWIVVAAGTITSGFAVFYYGTWLSIYANALSLLLLGAFSFDAETSLFIAFFNSAFSLTLSAISLAQKLLTPSTATENRGSNGAKKIVLLALPVFIAFIFFLLYRESNPLFQKVTDGINLDFISFNWLFFTLVGLLLMFGFFYHRAIRFFTAVDKRNSDELGYVSDEDHQHSFTMPVLSISNELYTGVALFAMLNLLLLAANSIDVYYMYILGTLPTGLTEAQYLHDGTNSLIFSIVLAIAIILFYFRGRLNFIENNRLIRLLTYGWILQNAFLIATTMQRNYSYVGHYGITQKRIGVYIFLSLCIIGLATTFLKVMSVKSNWYMFRKNTWVWYCTLVLASVINWDAIIASQNLRLGYEKKAAIDYEYLGGLSHTALASFFEFYSAEPKGREELKLYYPHLYTAINSQYLQLIKEVNSADWQSTCLIKMQSKKEIDALQAQVNP